LRWLVAQQKGALIKPASQPSDRCGSS
jgi:hypothetical protein